MTLHLITHGGCPDGFTSAWLLDRFLLDDEDVVHHFAYDRVNLPNGIEDGDRVIIADYSYPRDVLVELSERCPVTLLDHHKTAEDDLKGLELRPNMEIIFDMGRSGARIVWDWLMSLPGSSITNSVALLKAENLVNHIQDYDLWTKELPNTEEVNASIQSTPYEFENWDELAYHMDGNGSVLVTEGKAIRRYQRKIIDAAKHDKRRMDIGGHEVWVTQAPYALGSMIAGELASENPDDSFAAYYIDKPNGRQFGLRSRSDDGPGFDVSEVAKVYDGGGHHNASGFIVDREYMNHDHAAKSPGGFR